MVPDDMIQETPQFDGGLEGHRSYGIHWKHFYRHWRLSYGMIPQNEQTHKLSEPMMHWDELFGGVCPVPSFAQ